jgi:protoporphyrinogen oxidase
MVRVLVVGAGLAGLACALEATTSGHHVVVLERSSRIGGRGTTQNLDEFPVGYGPHLFLKKGPFHDRVRKLSRVKLAASPLRLDRTVIIGQGVVRPFDDIKTSVTNKRILRDANSEHALVDGCQFLSSWGGKTNTLRYDGLQKNQLMVSNEGWAGMVGRLAAALDEVGVFIECGPEVQRIESGKVFLADGREIETDVIVLACGPSAAKKLTRTMNEQRSVDLFSSLERISASFVEVGLDSKSLSGKHAVIDVQNQQIILDYRAIQPRLGREGSHLSALAIGGLESEPGETRYASADERLESLKSFLDKRASGWQNHVIQQSEQSKITLHDAGTSRIPQQAMADVGVLFAGAWVEGEHILADAAIASGRLAGRSIAAAKR